jgi:uroporphyrin-III C-methyltransferase
MSVSAIQPSVVLVGAGPGDPELISLKGKRAIERAAVILYDALAAEKLLEWAPSGCKKINVGKRKGRHAFTQDEINQLIVFHACRYGTVVRLKGGDPFVFGRGHEEAEYARRRGIPVEVIPGISSCLAAPSAAGIPVTLRGVSESFWVVTGTLSNGSISTDIALAAQSTATVVILMGMHNLPEICEQFIKHRGAHEPAAVIQHATTTNQRSLHCPLGELDAEVRHQGLGAPAVIVIGAVARAAMNEFFIPHSHTAAAF